MGRNHIKRLTAPKSWHIKRKGITFVTRPMPGPHGMDAGMPFNKILTDVLKLSNSTRESKNLLRMNEIKVDGRTRKNHKLPVGIFDTIELTSSNEYFRIVLNKKGKLSYLKTTKADASLKPCKIIGKTMVKGKLQLNLYDGKNLLVDKGDYKVGDTVLLDLQDNKISKHLKLDKKSTVFLVGGKHNGAVAQVEEVVGQTIIYKDSNGDLVETSKKYAFVVGDSKPAITLK